MLIPTSDLGRFDSMVLPIELEAYENLKSRSGKQRDVFYLCSSMEHHVQFTWKKQGIIK